MFGTRPSNKQQRSRDELVRKCDFFLGALDASNFWGLYGELSFSPLGHLLMASVYHGDISELLHELILPVKKGRVRKVMHNFFYDCHVLLWSVVIWLGLEICFISLQSVVLLLLLTYVANI